MIIPTGEKKRLRLNLFGQLQEKRLHDLLIEKKITEEQLFTFKQYIQDTQPSQ